MSKQSQLATLWASMYDQFESSAQVTPFNANGQRLPKLPIPRIVGPNTVSIAGRVSRACQPCREKKIKCSGHRPACRRCKTNAMCCIYEERKREINIKQRDHLVNQIEVYESLLRELCPVVDSAIADRISRVMGTMSADPRLLKQTLNTDSPSPSESSVMETDEIGAYGRSDTSFPAIALAYTTEDFNQKEAMGYVGDHSEIAWLYRLKSELNESEQNALTSGEPHHCPAHFAISSVNYYWDEVDLQVPGSVDFSQKPTQDVADRLLTTYFGLTHVYYPFVRKAIFLDQYRSFYSNPSLRPGRKWMAIFNLVLAIAARQSRVRSAGPESDDSCNPESDNHSIYFGRAWHLALSGSVLHTSNLQQVQVEALASLYLLSVGHANKAWKLCGVALRSAVMMGLHLRSESDNLTSTSRESRYQLWWALRLLETALCETTGRPVNTNARYCTTPRTVRFSGYEKHAIESIKPPPRKKRQFSSFLTSSGPQTSQSLPIRPILHSEDQEEHDLSATARKPPNDGSSYLPYAVQLDYITRKAISTIYSPANARMSWRRLESIILPLNSAADHWLSSLDPSYRFPTSDETVPLVPHRTSLAFRFYSTRMLILQPCLQVHLYHTLSNNTPSPLCESMATLCIRSACDLIDILPDEPNTAWLGVRCPWWRAMHYLMRSLTILMTGLLKGSQVLKSHTLEVALRVDKAFQWLSVISSWDPLAQRASYVCRDILDSRRFKAQF